MPVAKSRSLSAGVITGLIFIQKYRALTIAQFARIGNFSQYHAAELLRDLSRWGFLGHFGYVSIPHHGKTPKLYYLKRKGFELLAGECPDSIEETGEFKQVHTEVVWTPQMYHRIKIVDLMISAERAIQARPHLTIYKTFLSYKQVKKGLYTQRETTDYISNEETSDTKIIPDAAFILENLVTKKRGLFLLEMDMATEQIISRMQREKRTTIYQKLLKYDIYLQSLRYTKTYAAYGDFRYFTLLFVTASDTRLENIRREAQTLSEDLAGYYRFTTFDRAMGDFFGRIWKSRAVTDTNHYALVKENGGTSDG